MSFFSGNRQGCNPGPISGNPLQGLCEKACIQTRKVFDACMKQLQMDSVSLTLADITPEGLTAPYTFVSCNTQTANVTIENLVVDRFNDKPCFARVSGSTNVPITVNFTDSNGTQGSGTGTMNIPFDVVLYVPQPSVIPYEVTAFANAICTGGTFVSETSLTVSTCVTLIIRVVVDAEILIPTYGYCQIPPCQDYTQDVCSGYFDLPLYPAQEPVAPPTQINQN